MARMSVDDKFLRDPRVMHLAALCGWNIYEARGHLLDVWAVCYDQMTPCITAGIANLAAVHVDFAKHALESDLAVMQKTGKLWIRGVEERIKYIVRKIESGKLGGLKSAEARNKEPKQCFNHTSSTRRSTPQAPGNPVAVAVAVDVAASASAAVVVDVAKELRSTHVASPPVSRRSSSDKSKPGDPTDIERASAMVVLGKLGKQSGTAYRGSAEHVRLITARLRDGISETDMRAIIGFVADDKAKGGKGWRGDPNMHQHLTPEVLFGPRNVEKYLDPARTWWAKLDLPPTNETPVRREPGCVIDLSDAQLDLGGSQ